MSDELLASPLVAALAALLGVVFGLGLARFVLPEARRARRLEEELDNTRKEVAAYKARVADHFQRTGELIGQMTASYKAVYDHLAEGAQALCTDGAGARVGFRAPRLIVDETVVVTTTGTVSGGAPQAAMETGVKEEGDDAPAREVGSPSLSEASQAPAERADPVARETKRAMQEEATHDDDAEGVVAERGSSPSADPGGGSTPSDRQETATRPASG